MICLSVDAANQGTINKVARSSIPIWRMPLALSNEVQLGSLLS